MTMTDAELIERLRANSSWGDGRFAEAADRIEALTAERDDWKKRHFQMRDERDTQAIAAKNYADFNHEWRKRAEKAEADAARLRAALTGIKRAAAHRMQNDRRDLHSYYFHTAAAALNAGKDDT